MMMTEDLPRMRPLSPGSQVLPEAKRLRTSGGGSGSGSDSSGEPEDMDLIEVLWKQDVDLGFTLVDPAKNSASTSKKESEDDLEKLKALQAINHADEKEPKIKEEPPQGGGPVGWNPFTPSIWKPASTS
ncbi:uncharacterized protein LOC131669944 isoform X2 [Phymastichus coffea]|uniref:uncharacterized protein LOC131669944 isoform X2 n=1 Tax=Phymastichus coffea TaxID=108790 RepID=UPI00273A829C|nr:uncharacterized protein LOC131669944 isoform X2 [Phymastichus coffea]